ncbi:MAG: VCBS repeat-containing protein, partial [Acidobacteria bacterium]|nr:VCBS repeat-containing protein [Acidobacteriota bacterium]
DIENDGDLDVFFVQGAMLDPELPLSAALDPPRHPQPLTDRLYRNDTEAGGPLRFTDVTAVSGSLSGGYGMGVAAGDYDGDGWTDLYVTRLGPNQLLHNRGDGTFEDSTLAAGVQDDRWNVPATFFDYDRDGRLDLFVGAYLLYRLEAEPECASLLGRRDYCGASHFEPLPDRLFRNQGDGTFEDATEQAGLARGFGPALGALAADLDGDGWQDLYVTNDAAPNNLWYGRGDGTFEDRALLAGTAVNGLGRPEASMGVDAGDYDGDGDLDLFVTHLITETDTLYRNEGRGVFSDRTDAAGLGAPSRDRTGFGTGWLDFDDDGWLDLVIVGGAVQIHEHLAQRGDPFPLHETNRLLRNLGGAGTAPRFEDVSGGCGPVWELSEVSRGLALGDLDDDGDL